jgi:hypothetical protein
MNALNKLDTGPKGKINILMNYSIVVQALI